MINHMCSFDNDNDGMVSEMFLCEWGRGPSDEKQSFCQSLGLLLQLRVLGISTWGRCNRGQLNTANVKDLFSFAGNTVTIKLTQVLERQTQETSETCKNHNFQVLIQALILLSNLVFVLCALLFKNIVKELLAYAKNILSGC